MSYQIYVTDALWGLMHWRTFEERFRDFLFPPPEETRTAEEIISHIRAKLKEV